MISDARAEIKHSWIMILIMSQNPTEDLFREISLPLSNRAVVIRDQFSTRVLSSPCYQHPQSELDAVKSEEKVYIGQIPQAA